MRRALWLMKPKRFKGGLADDDERLERLEVGLGQDALVDEVFGYLGEAGAAG